MRIGRYEVLSELARGGMGGVLLAHDPAGAVVVLKMQASPDDDARLVDEARIGARLSHPALVETKELIDHQGRPVLVLGYVPGVTLHVCRRAGPMPVAVVARVFRQAAEALAAIHAATDTSGRPLGIIHRDISPTNIMLGFDGDARVIDLGIARSSESRAERTAAGMFRGTVRYIAPEILGGAKQSQASDVWALGLSLFEAALGRRSSSGSEAEILATIFSGRVLAIEQGEHLPSELAAVVDVACAKDPARRATARDVAAMLARVERAHPDARTAVAHFVSVVSRMDVGGTTGTQSRLIAEARAVYGERADESGPIARAPGPHRAPVPREFVDVAPTLVDDEFASIPPTVQARPHRPSTMLTEENPPPRLADPWDLPPPLTGEEHADVPAAIPNPVDLGEES